MCEIVGMSETDLDWEGSIEKKESSIAELNGRKYEMTILEQDATFASAIYKHGPHGCSLQNRSVTNGQINPTKVGGSVEVELIVKFGGKEGTQYSSSAKGEIHDAKGNYVRGSATRDHDGEGSVAVAAGHAEREMKI